MQASEAAASGDAALVRELQDLLSDPYGLQEEEEEVGVGGAAEGEGGGEGARLAQRRARWFAKTPTWARNMPGCDFYSCSS